MEGVAQGDDWGLVEVIGFGDGQGGKCRWISVLTQHASCFVEYLRSGCFQQGTPISGAGCPLAEIR